MGKTGYLDQLRAMTTAQLRAEVRGKARAAAAQLLAEPAVAEAIGGGRWSVELVSVRGVGFEVGARVAATVEYRLGRTGRRPRALRVHARLGLDGRGGVTFGDVSVAPPVPPAGTPGGRWTEEEDQVVWAYRAAEAAARTGRTLKAIHARRMALGVRNGRQKRPPTDPVPRRPAGDRGEGIPRRSQLPPPPPVLPPDARRSFPPLPSPPGHRVLVVEDAATLCRLVTGCLRAEGFEVAQAQGGEEAAQLVAGSPGSFRLAMIGVRLRGLDGVALAARLRRLAPALPVVLMGDGADRPRGESLGEGLAGFLQKPFTSAGLLTEVKRVLLGMTA
jgi:CheY-like chemotaxis protein